MTRHSSILAGILLGSASLGYGYSGFSGHSLDGALEASPYYVYSTISAPQNWSNLGAPLALVGNGAEFSADFQDAFSQQWHLTADFQDNYQVVLTQTAPTSQASIGAGDWLVRWRFYGFDFQVGGLQLVSGPSAPFDTSAIVSYDADNVWIGFNHLYEVPEQGTYTFQLVPVPEPGNLGMFVLGAFVCLAAQRAGFQPRHFMAAR